MALITPDCGTRRSPSIKWPWPPRVPNVVCPCQVGALGAGGVERSDISMGRVAIKRRASTAAGVASAVLTTEEERIAHSKQLDRDRRRTLLRLATHHTRDFRLDSGLSFELNADTFKKVSCHGLQLQSPWIIPDAAVS